MSARTAAVPLLAGVLLLTGGTSHAVDPGIPGRLDLGRLVQRLEATWVATPEEGARRRAVDTVAESIAAWFRVDLAAVAENLVVAEALLRRPEGPTASDLWGGSVLASIADRVIAPGDSLTVGFARAFPIAAPPAGASVEIEVAGERRRVDTPLPDHLDVPFPITARGDLPVTIRLRVDEVVVRTIDEIITVIPPWDERLDALEETLRGARRSVVRDTARGILGRLRALDRDFPPELPFGAAAELERAERLAPRAAAGEPAPELGAAGDRWVRLPVGFGGTPCRILVPESAEDGLVPLVVACHGMGGSEHLFFEAHGLGLGPRLAAERGWIFASPGFGPVSGGPEVDALVSALEAFLPIDRERVFLIGHSLGAVRIAGAAARDPKRYRAIAPLSGGGVIPSGTDLEGLPCFLAVGDRDFGKGMSMALASALSRAGARVTERVYAPSEHLLMVADALPDVFAFFDAQLEGASGASGE